VSVCVCVCVCVWCGAVIALVGWLGRIATLVDRSMESIDRTLCSSTLCRLSFGVAPID
jgi:predicted benzoate:H+ symporter BenE